MIYFDNLQAYSTISTHNITEAIAGIFEAANAHVVETRERAYFLGDGSAHDTWSRIGNVWDTTGASTIAAAASEGAIVVDVSLPNHGTILFGAGQTQIPTYGIGVRIYDGVLQFVDQAGTPYQKVQLPVADLKIRNEGDFRIVLHEVTTSKLEIEYKVIVVYQGLRFVGAQAFLRENDASTQLVYLKHSEAGKFTLTIQEFSTPALEHSLDPGETPQSSLSRVIKGLTIKMVARYNTHIKITRPIPGMTAIMDLSGYRDLSSAVREHNYDARYSRIRAVSAYPEAEYIDTRASDEVGGQFAIVSNPNIITIEGASAEAERAQNVSDSEAETLSIEGPSCLILEPDDLITIDGENWIAIEGDRRIGADGSHMSSVRFRKYTGVA
ncbi:MAG: hypothetical protein WBF17_08145 [Phycisphaerae bacterium]